jgi:hypothetical protein
VNSHTRLYENPTAIRFHGNGTWMRIFGSTFDNTWNGIVSSASGRSVIYDNQMNRVTDRGVTLNDAIGGSLQLLEFNSIHHWSRGTGVWVTRSEPFTDIRISGNTIGTSTVGILTENNSNSFLYIGGNTIFNPGPINMPSSRYNCGIWVNDPMLSTSYIGTNTITSRWYGIHTFGGAVFNERIWRNNISMVSMVTPSISNATNWDIVSRNRNTPILISNYVKGVGISQQLSFSTRLQGILLNDTDNPIAYCNEMDNTHTGMIAMGDNTTADLQRNVMQPAQVGFLFKDNGQVGAQGSLTQTNDNEWHCQFTTSALRAENSFAAIFSPFYVQTGTSPFDPGLCPNVVSSSSTLLTAMPAVMNPGSASSSTIDCDPNYFLRTAESDSSSEFEEREVFDPVYGPDTLSEELISWYHLLVLDSLDFGIYPEYNRLISRLNLYRKLARYETLRETDSIFNSFYTIADSGTEKFISNLLNAVGNNNIEDGVELLSEWTPSNTTEEAWWNWFEISFRLRENSSDTLSSGLTDSIVYYASMCPDAFGYPVYAARTILMRLNLDTLIEMHECENWSFTDEIDSSEIDYDNPENTILSIYPNPANIEVSFEHDLEETEAVRIKVYDSMGNLRLNEAFGTSQRTLVWDTSLEITGMYYVLLLQDDVLIESKSLAIIH